MIRHGTALRAVDYALFKLLSRTGKIWFGLLAALALVALVLGSLGFHRVSQQRGLVGSAPNDLYQALQLFVLGAPSFEGEIPLALNSARFLAAVVSFSAVISLMGKVFFGQIQSIRLWALARRHVILCGLGDKGITLVEALRRKLHVVVVIEANSNHDDLAQCRALGAIALIGSSTDAWQMKKARVDRAEVLLALFGQDDRLNVETAVLAAELSQGARPSSLTCVLQIADMDLAAVVRKHKMAGAHDNGFQLEIFNMYDACARAMLREAVVGLAGTSARRVLIVGLGEYGRLGEMVILRAAKDWHIEHPEHAERLVIAVIDPEATRKVGDLKARNPFLDQVCDLKPHEVTPSGLATFDQASWLGRGHPPDVAFVCLHDEATGLVAADRLRSRLPAEVPIIVHTIERDAGLGALIRGRAAERLIAVGREDRVFQLAASLNPVQELLAQAVHQSYVRHARSQGAGGALGKPATHFWEDLEEDYRAANRAQAADIRRKLSTVGCKAVFVDDALIPLHEFRDDELDRLSRAEHERWCAERKSQGWTYGPVRDNGKKIHPNLVSWEDPRLDEPTKDFDRNAVRRLAAVLAMADYQVVRVD